MPHKNKEAQAAAARKHYEANKVKMKARAVIHKAKALVEKREFILQYLLEHPCITCGEADPIVLEFDHREPEKKEFSISQAVMNGLAMSKIIAEIAKCDVLCCNCHRRRTHIQFGWKSKNTGH